MDRKKIIKYILVLLIFSVSGYYLYQHGVELGLAKPALVMKISTNESAMGLAMIHNVTFEQSSVAFFYKRGDAVPEFPEIEVNARLNQLDAAPASFWASQHYDGVGVYTLRVFFRDGKEPKPGDILILPIRIIGSTGVPMYKTTAFYIWE